MNTRRNVSIEDSKICTPKEATIKSDTESLLDIYIENCKRFELHVDPSVVIALKTNWPILQPTKTFSEGSLLPLIEILEDSLIISKINLSNVAMNDARYSMNIKSKIFFIIVCDTPGLDPRGMAILMREHCEVYCKRIRRSQNLICRTLDSMMTE